MKFTFIQGLKVDDKIIGQVQCSQIFQSTREFLSYRLYFNQKVVTQVEILQGLKSAEMYTLKSYNSILTFVKLNLLSCNEISQDQEQQFSEPIKPIEFEPYYQILYSDLCSIEKVHANQVVNSNLISNYCLHNQENTELKICEIDQFFSFESIQRLDFTTIYIKIFFTYDDLIQLISLALQKFIQFPPFFEFLLCITRELPNHFQDFLTLSTHRFRIKMYFTGNNIESITINSFDFMKVFQNWIPLLQNLQSNLGHYNSLTLIKKFLSGKYFFGKLLIAYILIHRQFIFLVYRVQYLIYSSSLNIRMRPNLWNLRSSKQRLGIFEKTQAQKRHLQGILQAKSTINTSSPALNVSPCKKICYNWESKSPKIDKSHISQRYYQCSSRSYKGSQQNLAFVGRNLQVYSSVHRLMKKKTIDEQNLKIFQRILTANPTIKRKKFIKMEEQNSKYKENLNRKKYKIVDYSQQAMKLMKNEPKFQFLKMTLSSSRSNDKFSKHRY